MGIRSFLRKWRYRHYDRQELIELNELMIMWGRRVTHDLEHTVSELQVADYMAGNVKNPFTSTIIERCDMWKRAFYPIHGPKNYRSKLYKEKALLEREIGRLKTLCIKHGIDPTDPDAIPF